MFLQFLPVQGEGCESWAIWDLWVRRVIAHILELTQRGSVLCRMPQISAKASAVEALHAGRTHYEAALSSFVSTEGKPKSTLVPGSWRISVLASSGCHLSGTNEACAKRCIFFGLRA